MPELAPQEGDIFEKHTVAIHDPYRWLEDLNTDTQRWIDVQNQAVSQFIEEDHRFSVWKEELTRRWNYDKYGIPSKEGDYYIFWKKEGLQNQSVLYQQDTLDSEPSALLDPNTLSEDGTVAVEGATFSKDGKLFAYTVHEGGSDKVTIKIRNVETGEDIEDTLKSRFCSIEWYPDGYGFFYTWCDIAADGAEEDEEKTGNIRLHFHQLGTPQSSDVLVYDEPHDKDIGVTPKVSDDKQYLVIEVSKALHNENRVYYKRIDTDGPFESLFDKNDAHYSYITNIGDIFYFVTTKDAPKSRLISIDRKDPVRTLKEVIPESEHVLEWATFVGGKFAVCHLEHAHDKLHIHETDGSVHDEIQLPTLGVVNGLSGKHDSDEFFFGFTSYLDPPTSFRYSIATEKTELIRKPNVECDPSNFETTQVFVTSKDGTKVPMFITRKRGIELDGTNPTLLYGYGGFEVNLQPHFSISRMLWLEHGGIAVDVNLRGGSEYGEGWHKAGMLEKKQNVFDDFISAAEWLIAHKYTSPEKLAIEGGSNGGLLVAACMLQRPDLYGAVLCEVPVTDMLRFHKFGPGRYWKSEYGDPENPEHLPFLLKYSPLHNIRQGVRYAATLILTAENDDRVEPLHARKFGAALQKANGSNNPILIHSLRKAGHGHGMSTEQAIENASRAYAFLEKVFDM